MKLNEFEAAYKKLITENFEESVEEINEPSHINFSININLENDAFNADPEARDTEIISILEKVISDIEDGKQLEQDSWPIMDINGNNVGEVTYN